MQIRDNVRERRRERIEQLIGRHAMEEANNPEPSLGQNKLTESTAETASRKGQVTEEPVRLDANAKYPAIDMPAGNLDPEQWWREREKRLKSGQIAGWQGLKGIPPTSSNRLDNYSSGFDWNKLFQGFTLRLAISALVFAGIWGWFKLELPGSTEARGWMVSSVTRDMDFQAVEAWYSETFGGSPSFFPFNKDEPDTAEVSALLNPSDTAIPVQGTLVENYAENGAGVKVAASGGSDVYAIYTGRVQQVTKDQDGGITILVQHANQILTVYGHLDKSSVKPNDWVETGQQIGQLGATEDGQSDGVLYFAVQQDGKSLNPADVVTFD